MSLHDAINGAYKELKEFISMYAPSEMPGGLLITETQDTWEVDRDLERRGLWLKDNNNRFRKISDAEIAECLALAAGETA